MRNPLFRFTLAGILVGIFAGCSPAAPAETTDVSSPVVEGDRLLLVLEGRGVAGGEVSLAAPGIAPLALTGFEAPTGLQVVSDYTSEVYLLSDPVTRGQIDALTAKDSKLTITSNMLLERGMLIADTSKDVRGSLAVWHAEKGKTTITLLADLGRPVHLGRTQ